MPSNEQLSTRAKELLADIKALTKSAKANSDAYKSLANAAYANLQGFLESKGVTTVDEWLAICEKELSAEEQAIVQKTLADLEPPQGIKALMQPTEIAKFIASWYILKGGIPLFRLAALSAKSWYHGFLVINRMPVVSEVGTVAGEIELTSVASSSEDLAEAAEFLEGDEVPALVAAAEVEVGEVVAAEAVAAAEVATVATVEVAGSWNLFFLAAGAVVLMGTYSYEKYKESEDADKLKEMIAHVATARLYALVAEKSLLLQTDGQSLLSQLNEALKQGNDAVADFFKRSALDTIQNGVKTINIQDCYDQLIDQDVKSGFNIEADPSLNNMIERHAKEVQEIRKKGKPMEN